MSVSGSRVSAGVDRSMFMQGTNLLNYCANLGFYLIYYFV